MESIEIEHVLNPKQSKNKIELYIEKEQRQHYMSITSFVYSKCEYMFFCMAVGCQFSGFGTLLYT